MSVSTDRDAIPVAAILELALRQVAETSRCLRALEATVLADRLGSSVDVAGFAEVQKFDLAQQLLQDTCAAIAAVSDGLPVDLGTRRADILRKLRLEISQAWLEDILAPEGPREARPSEQRSVEMF